jgi:pimeloyl-[acyl-carrier protein] methyl ester esterase
MVKRLVLLPGMHGDGKLFSDFMSRIPEPKHLEAVNYPAEESFSYSQLLEVVQSFVPASDPYFLLAESFSTPLAIQFAATNPANLKGLILCAGFASSPLTGPSRLAASLFAPLVFGLPVFGFAMDRFLIGPNPPELLHAAVRAAVSSVSPNILAARLRAVLCCDRRQHLSRIQVPMLYIQATNDMVVPKSCLDEIRRVKPDIRVAEINGPHLILQRETIQSADIVAKFIQEFQ